MLEEHLQNTLIYLKANPIIAVVLGLFIAFCFYSKPKEMFKLLIFCVFLAVVFYIITLFAGAIGSGGQGKSQMIYKTKDAIGE